MVVVGCHYEESACMAGALDGVMVAAHGALFVDVEYGCEVGRDEVQVEEALYLIFWVGLSVGCVVDVHLAGVEECGGGRCLCGWVLLWCLAVPGVL
jgi:hypothetical protein